MLGTWNVHATPPTHAAKFAAEPAIAAGEMGRSKAIAGCYGDARVCAHGGSEVLVAPDDL